MANKTATNSKLAGLRDTRWSELDARIVLEAVERSGDTIHAFAREHGLPAHRLYWWRERLAGAIDEDPGDLGQLSFAPVVVTGLGRAPAMLVRVGELELEIIEPQRVDPAWLAQVIAATKGAR
jgi:transposase-like protein